MTRLQLRYIVQENVIALLMNKMREAAEDSHMPWDDFFDDFISHMQGITAQMARADEEKIMAAIHRNPRAGYECIVSQFVLSTKDDPVHRFIAVALANISYRSRLPEEIPYLASRLIIQALTDHHRLKYTPEYFNACFSNPEKAYGGKAEDEVPEENIGREYGNPKTKNKVFGTGGIFTT